MLDEKMPTEESATSRIERAVNEIMDAVTTALHKRDGQAASRELKIAAEDLAESYGHAKLHGDDDYASYLLDHAKTLYARSEKKDKGVDHLGDVSEVVRSNVRHVASDGAGADS